ncbi:type VII secretion target [Nocardia transvalensis]|uniref:type VII secretion target n=1 Tax=Nocardia transvalensis TaxID=37333 RepID=UPI001894DE4B|nr:type VII secretion target [Nocardia transvalensis]MBF6330443.1 ESX-1 secretion-associated protein [Nocardia transvalensis]
MGDTPAVRLEPGTLVTFAKNLRDEAGTVAKLNSGLANAATALPGTTWDATCQQAKDSVDKALRRIGDRLTTLADSIEQAGKVFIQTDEQFADDLAKVGLRQ